MSDAYIFISKDSESKRLLKWIIKNKKSIVNLKLEVVKSSISVPTLFYDRYCIQGAKDIATFLLSSIPSEAQTCSKKAAARQKSNVPSDDAASVMKDLVKNFKEEDNVELVDKSWEKNLDKNNIGCAANTNTNTNKSKHSIEYKLSQTYDEDN